MQKPETPQKEKHGGQREMPPTFTHTHTPRDLVFLFAGTASYERYVRSSLSSNPKPGQYYA